MAGEGCGRGNHRVGHLPILVLLGLAVIAAGWLAWPRIRPITDPTWERVKRERVLRVGLDPTYPPFGYYDEADEIVGYDVDLARALAGRLGLRVELVPVHFDGLYDALAAGRADVLISALPFDPRRTKDVLYSPPYFQAGQVIVARADDTAVKSVRDLTGRRVAVEWGSSGDVEIRRLADRGIQAQVVRFETPQAALAALEQSRVDVTVVDAVSAYHFVNRNGDFKVIQPPLTNEPYVMAFRADSPVLWDTLNRALAQLSVDGYLQQLLARWF